MKQERRRRALTFRRRRRDFLVALAAALHTPRALAHKFHTSFTEASYNAEAGTLEVTLRTFPDDLEAAVRRRASSTPSAAKDQKKEFEERVAAYVAETFRLRTEKGDPVKISWVGMDAGVDSAWLYFGPPARESEGVQPQPLPRDSSTIRSHLNLNERQAHRAALDAGRTTSSGQPRSELRSTTDTQR